jgi:hypothetical protein
LSFQIEAENLYGRRVWCWGFDDPQKRKGLPDAAEHLKNVALEEVPQG